MKTQNANAASNQTTKNETVVPGLSLEHVCLHVCMRFVTTASHVKLSMLTSSTSSTSRPSSTSSLINALSEARYRLPPIMRQNAQQSSRKAESPTSLQLLHHKCCVTTRFCFPCTQQIHRLIHHAQKHKSGSVGSLINMRLTYRVTC